MNCPYNVGGTCLSRPPFGVGSSIPFPRGLKSRAESGAKAPHSIWSAAIHRRFLVKALAFTTSALIRMGLKSPIPPGPQFAMTATPPRRVCPTRAIPQDAIPCTFDGSQRRSGPGIMVFWINREAL